MVLFLTKARIFVLKLLLIKEYGDLIACNRQDFFNVGLSFYSKSTYIWLLVFYNFEIEKDFFNMGLSFDSKSNYI